jgi:SAM-dependent methyltransferase
VRDLQELQLRMGFAGVEASVRAYQRRYVEVFAPGARVLDVGCGEGVFLALLKDAGRVGIGVDRSPADIARARARGLEVVEQDALAFIAEHRESFDGVFCAHLIEHLTPSDAVELIEGFRAALKPGGRLVLITPEVRDLEVLTERFWLDLTHVRPYPQALLNALLPALGFDVIESGNDPASARGRSWRSLPKRLWRALRFGDHGYRGDVYVVAARR